MHYYLASKHRAAAGTDVDLANALIDSSIECVHGLKRRRYCGTAVLMLLPLMNEDHWPATGVTRQVTIDGPTSFPLG